MITTKWPRLIVVGEPITVEQADEILVRTDGWYLATNDREWESVVSRIAEQVTGRPIYPTIPDSGGFVGFHQAQMRWRERLGILQLNYLRNARIASSWIGGPHGWCDWDGRIGCATYNIGKWPADEEVTEDWQTLATAFPFLDLTAQCVDEEGEGVLAAQWRVHGGAVEYTAEPEPATLIAPLQELSDSDLLGRLLGGMRTERGVSEERLRSALERVAVAGVAKHER